jgi:hypothetical protein
MSEDNIVPVDFGKDQRESARKLARLLGLVEQRERELLANPKPFLDRAYEEVLRLQLVLKRAHDALQPPAPVEITTEPPSFMALDVVSIPRDEYDRLRAMAAVIRSEA